MIQAMWSNENLTKIRKQADAKRIKIDSSVFSPSTLAECDEAWAPIPRKLQKSKNPLDNYFMKNSGVKRKSFLSPEMSMHVSQNVSYVRKPTRINLKEDSDEPGGSVSKLGIISGEQVKRSNHGIIRKQSGH